MHSAVNHSHDARRTRHANVRTALTLSSIAAVFFAGIISAQYTDALAVGLGVVGLGIIGFLLAAVSRRSSR